MIIQSLLDTDLYKFTMMQVVLHHFPGAQVEYRFKCRNAERGPARRTSARSAPRSRRCARCAFAPDELDYLRGWRFMKSDFVDFLGLFQFNERFIQRRARCEDPTREIDITIKGPWLHTILFEIPVLAIVSRGLFRSTQPQPDLARGPPRGSKAKIDQVERASPGPEFRISDYGTRRRFSRDWHDEVVRTFARRDRRRSSPAPPTSGSRCDHGLTPLGTMAHEYMQACQALGPRLRDSQIFAFDIWAQEYRGDLGIALSDICGTDAFLRDFDMYFCKLFDGARHDSGDPFDWGEKLIAHYQKNRIDPRTKTMIFSDQLTVPLAIQLFGHFRGPRC